MLPHEEEIAGSEGTKQKRRRTECEMTTKTEGCVRNTTKGRTRKTNLCLIFAYLKSNMYNMPVLFLKVIDIAQGPNRIGQEFSHKSTSSKRWEIDANLKNST